MNPLSLLDTLIVATGQYGWWVTYGNADFEVRWVWVYSCTHVSHSHLAIPFLFTSAGNFLLKRARSTRDFQVETGDCLELVEREEGTSCWQDTQLFPAAGFIDEDVSALSYLASLVTCQIECADRRTCPTQRYPLCLRCRLPAAAPVPLQEACWRQRHRQ